MLTAVLALLAVLSGMLMIWQWIAAVRFPLDERLRVPPVQELPSVTVLKPVKALDDATLAALSTWMCQGYPAAHEIVFGVDSPDDPALPALRALAARHPDRARVVICPERIGVNRKVSNLIQMARGLRSDCIVVSDADVAAPPDLLSQMASSMGDQSVGLVHCLYRFADAPTLATRWEAFAVNADFWSQVLQNRSFKPLDYALGAAMAVRRLDLEAIGGFAALAEYLADDNRLGHLIVRLGRRTDLCRLVVDCRSSPLGWWPVWRHQLRWAVTIRVCQGLPYFLSVLANGTLWPALWMALAPSALSVGGGLFLLGLRLVQGLSLEARFTRRRRDWGRAWLVPAKDFLQFGLWVGAFVCRHVIWGGVRYRVLHDGRLRAVGIPANER